MAAAWSISAARFQRVSRSACIRVVQQGLPRDSRQAALSVPPSPEQSRDRSVRNICVFLQCFCHSVARRGERFHLPYVCTFRQRRGRRFVRIPDDVLRAAAPLENTGPVLVRIAIAAADNSAHHPAFDGLVAIG